MKRYDPDLIFGSFFAVLLACVSIVVVCGTVLAVIGTVHAIFG